VARLGGVPPIPFDPEREEEELRAYLGSAYEPERLERWEQTLEEEYARIGDEAELYRSSEAYLYNLTAFAMTGTKRPYLAELARFIRPPARLLDYGCGIGSDGLALLEAGYRVAFADFDNPSTRYLRWRLDRRDLEAEVHDLDSGVPGGFDAAFAFDVIEHTDDPFAFLAQLESRAAVVAVNFLEPVPGESPLHHPLPVRELLARVRSRRLLGYGRHHGRSHLVVYEPHEDSGFDRLRSRLTYWRGRMGRGGRTA
jgi:SAM-dependent methyltransferase